MACIFGGKMDGRWKQNGVGENGSCGSCMGIAAGGAGMVCADFFLP